MSSIQIGALVLAGILVLFKVAGPVLKNFNLSTLTDLIRLLNKEDSFPHVPDRELVNPDVELNEKEDPEQHNHSLCHLRKELAGEWIEIADYVLEVDNSKPLQDAVNLISQTITRRPNEEVRV